MLIQASNHDCLSLAEQCRAIAVEQGLKISKQSLDKRMNNYSGSFLHMLLEKQLASQVSSQIPSRLLHSFSRVLIKDSTRFDLPSNMQEEFPGFGGSASASNACLQYEFDLKNSCITTLEVTPGIRSDSKDAKQTAGRVKTGDLVIRDLGYFCLEVLKTFSQANAFYLSRLDPSTKVYHLVEGNMCELDFNKLYDKMQKNKISQMEKQVFIGARDKLKVRLFISLASEGVREKRIDKRLSRNKQKGHHISQEFLDRASMNLFVSNVPADIMTLQQALLVYRLRWQIELIFKACKSIFGIDSIHKMKTERFRCILYARLLFILICWQIVLPLRNRLFTDCGLWLSLDKCFRSLQFHSFLMRKALTGSKESLLLFLQNIYSCLVYGHRLEKKKDKPGFENIITFIL